MNGLGCFGWFIAAILITATNAGAPWPYLIGAGVLLCAISAGCARGKDNTVRSAELFNGALAIMYGLELTFGNTTKPLFILLLMAGVSYWLLRTERVRRGLPEAGEDRP